MGAAQQLSSAFLDKDFINAFVQSVINTHKITVGVKIIPGKVAVFPVSEKNGEITGFLGIVSNSSKWILSISYAKESVLDIYNQMFGESKTALDNEVSDLVGEVTNQIYGGAKSILNQRGYAFEMALPTVISGEFRTHHHGGGATLSIPFSLEGKPNNIWVDIITSSSSNS